MRRDVTAVFVDRDRTVNRGAPLGGYITRPDDLQLLPGAGEAIRQLNERGIPVIVVTNQRGIALGQYDETALEAIHSRLREELAVHGASLDAIYYCPHDIAACDCRKPKPGLLQRAARDFELDLTQTAVIGDADSDMQAAAAVGAMRLCVGRCQSADYHASDLADAVAWLIDEDIPGG